MTIFQAIVLGIVEGLTEFLPISSTGHLTITEKLLGLQVDDAGVTAFTALVQIGAILAVLVYFHTDITRMVTGWCRGLIHSSARTSQEWRFGWYIIAGSVPIGIAGLAGKDLITSARNLWVVSAALIGWSAVMAYAEHRATQRRGELDLRLPDVIFIGVAQCAALIPGVSRSGATISAGLLRGLDRVTATRLSFFLSIPAMLAAGAFEAVDASADIGTSVGWIPTLIAAIVAFAVAYASIAWLLKFVVDHKITVFIWYRIVIGLLLAAALATGLVTAT